MQKLLLISTWSTRETDKPGTLCRAFFIKSMLGETYIFALPEAPASHESRLGGTRICELGYGKKRTVTCVELGKEKSDPHKTWKTLILTVSHVKPE